MAVAVQAVREAQGWARQLVQRESRGSGDQDNAIRRLCNRYDGLTPSMLEALLYRPPKDILVSKYVALQTAFISECEKHERALRHEREVAQAKSILGSSFIRAGSALSRAADVLDGEESR